MDKAAEWRCATVIPAYNEAATVADIVRRACAYSDLTIVVDDGSCDGTAEKLTELPVTVLRNPINRGKGASLVHGCDYALAYGVDAIVTLDADGQHRPEDIPRLQAAARAHPGCIVIAARTRRRTQAPRLRRVANRIADFWISWAAGYPIKDTQSGFRLYPVDVLSALPPHFVAGDGFVFESEILIEAARAGYYSIAIDIDTIYAADARPSHYRPLRDTVRIARMVAGKLLRRGLYPLGLLRALRLMPLPSTFDRDKENN